MIPVALRKEILRKEMIELVHTTHIRETMYWPRMSKEYIYASHRVKEPLQQHRFAARPWPTYVSLKGRTLLMVSGE